MFNKKFLIAVAVAGVVTNASAFEVNGYNITGGVGGKVNNLVTKKGSAPKTTKTANDANVYRARVRVVKNVATNLNVFSEVDAGNKGGAKDPDGLQLVALELQYKLSDSLQLNVGKNVVDIVGYADHPNGYVRAFDGIGGGRTGKVDPNGKYNLKLAYNANGLSVNVAGAYAGNDTDALDTTTSDGDTRFAAYKDKKQNTYGVARVNYVSGNVAVGAGTRYRTLLDDREKDDNNLDLYLDADYSGNGVYGYVAGGYSTGNVKDKLKNNAETDTDGYSVAAGLLYGVNGEIGHYGSVVKADNLVYAGVNFVYDYANEDKKASQEKTETTSSTVTGVLGYAPSTNLKLYVQYGVGNVETQPTTASVKGTKTTTKTQDVSGNVKFSF